MKSLDTGGLLALFQSGEAIDGLLEEGKESMRPCTLQEYLQTLLHGKKLTIPQLIIATGFSKSYLYQLFEGQRNAGRDAALRLAFGMQLSLEETQRLLTLSHNNILYPRVRRDAVFIFALHRRLSLEETELLLTELGEKLLCGSGQDE